MEGTTAQTRSLTLLVTLLAPGTVGAPGRWVKASMGHGRRLWGTPRPAAGSAVASGQGIIPCSGHLSGASTIARSGAAFAGARARRWTRRPLGEQNVGKKDALDNGRKGMPGEQGVRRGGPAEISGRRQAPASGQTASGQNRGGMREGTECEQAPDIYKYVHEGALISYLAAKRHSW